MSEGIVIRVYKRITFFNRQKWAFRIYAENGRVLAGSEKYHNHEDALHAARLIQNGPVRIENSPTGGAK